MPLYRNRRDRMPRPRPRARMYTRRKAHAIVRRRYRKSNIPKPYNFAPLGKSKAIQCRYVLPTSFDNTAGQAFDTVIRANGMFFPDYANGATANHQPYGFDQISPLFYRYTVLGAKIRVEVPNSQSNAQMPFYVGVQLRTSFTSLTSNTSRTQLLELPGWNWKLMGNPQGGGTRIVTNKFSARKFFNQVSAHAMIGSDEFSGEVTNTTTGGTNPQNEAYFHVVTFPLLSGDDLAVNGITIIVDYYVVFSDPQIQAFS